MRAEGEGEGEAEGACEGEGESEGDIPISVLADLPMGIANMHRACKWSVYL